MFTWGTRWDFHCSWLCEGYWFYQLRRRIWVLSGGGVHRWVDQIDGQRADGRFVPFDNVLRTIVDCGVHLFQRHFRNDWPVLLFGFYCHQLRLSKVLQTDCNSPSSVDVDATLLNQSDQEIDQLVDHFLLFYVLLSKYRVLSPESVILSFHRADFRLEIFMVVFELLNLQEQLCQNRSHVAFYVDNLPWRRRHLAFNHFQTFYAASDEEFVGEFKVSLVIFQRWWFNWGNFMKTILVQLADEARHVVVFIVPVGKVRIHNQQ